MKKRIKLHQKLIIVQTLAALTLTALLGGCGNNYEKNLAAASAPMEAAGDYYDAGDYYGEDYEMEEAAYGDYDGETGAAAPEVGESSETAQASGRKLIRTVNMDAETEDFDGLIADLKVKTESAGGYIESSSISSDSGYYNDDLPPLRDASYTIRIPADKLDSFLNSVSSRLNILSRNENVEDITLSYVDMESHKKALREEQDRIYKLMEEAENLDELIVLEQRLTEVTYQIESIEAQLRTYDNRVNYSTVYLNISEVRKYTPVAEESAGEKIKRGFGERMEAIGNGFKNFGIWFVVHIMDIALVVVLILVIILVIRLLIHLVSRSLSKNEAKRQVRDQRILEREQKRAAEQAARQQKKAAEQAAREQKKAMEQAAKQAGKKMPMQGRINPNTPHMQQAPGMQATGPQMTPGMQTPGAQMAPGAPVQPPVNTAPETTNTQEAPQSQSVPGTQGAVVQPGADQKGNEEK